MAEATEPKPKNDAVVEYVGGADVRKITADEWKQAGVEGQAETVWDSSNDFKVKASDLSPAALKVLEANGGFKL